MWSRRIFGHDSNRDYLFRETIAPAASASNRMIAGCISGVAFGGVPVTTKMQESVLPL